MNENDMIQMLRAIPNSRKPKLFRQIAALIRNDGLLSNVLVDDEKIVQLKTRRTMKYSVS